MGSGVFLLFGDCPAHRLRHRLWVISVDGHTNGARNQVHSSFERVCHAAADAKRGSSSHSSHRQCSKRWPAGPQNPGYLKCITSAEDVGLPGEHVCKSDPWELHSDRLHSMTEWAVFLFCCTWSCACILTYSDDNQCSCAPTWWVPQESCLQLIGCKAQQCSCAYQTALLASICT